MQKSILFLLAGLVFTHPASAYRLIQFENQEFRDYTDAELRGLIGTDAQYLEHYTCDGQQEFQLFTEAYLQNFSADSLLIQSNGKNYVYRDGSLYAEGNGTSIDISTLSDAFVSQAFQSLNALQKLPSAATLLRKLQQSRYRIFIAKGGNRFDAREENGRAGFGLQEAQVLIYLNTLRKADNILPFHQLGVGGFVFWDPNGKYPSLESDDRTRDTPREVTLAHELYHAYDSVRGLLDQRHVDGEGYEFQAVVEYRGVYFENQIRAELGLHYRKAYGKELDEKGSSMLDAEGKPILIPSACINASVEPQTPGGGSTRSTF